MGVDLSTVQSAASWASITLPATDTANVAGNLGACITAASIEFLRLTGRGPMDFSVPFNSPFTQSVTYTELYDGNGNDEMYLRNMPVTSIAEVTVNGQKLQAAANNYSYGYQIGRTGRSVVLTGGYPMGLAPYGRCGWGGVGFARGRNNVSVTYTAGFALVPVANELATIPASGAFTCTVASLLAGRSYIGDLGVRYFSDGTPLTAVTTAPAAGQYYLEAPGVYLFNSADAGKQVQISYDSAGTPADIILAVNQMVALNYKRRNWIGQQAIYMKDVGSTKYTLVLDPEILRVVDYYRRRGTN